MAPALMANRDLDGQGEELLTVVRNYATPQEWGAWLRVPLSGAAAEGNVELVDSLVAAGADAGPGSREDGATLLHAAAEGGNMRVLQIFLDAGCKSDVNQQESVRQLSPLHVAAEEGHSRLAGVLIRAGASVDVIDSEGRTPLHLAAKNGHAGVVVDLLLRGSNVEAEDKTGSRPLHLAVEGGHREVLSLLIRAGCDPDCEHRLTGRRPLYTAALGGRYKIMRILIEAGADKDAKINLGRGRSGNFTALHAAAELGGVDSVSVLVEKNAFLEARSDAASTPLHLAASAGAIDTVMILANAGADIEARDALGHTPLSNACMFLRTSVASFLVDWGADLDVVDNEGKNIQHAVGARIADGTEGKEDRVIDLLDLLGCDPLVPVSSGSSPSSSMSAGGGEVDKESRSGSFLGGLSMSFPKVSKIFGCVGTGYNAVK
eukprot:g13201.t1